MAKKNGGKRAVKYFIIAVWTFTAVISIFTAVFIHLLAALVVAALLSMVAYPLTMGLKESVHNDQPNRDNKPPKNDSRGKN